MCKIYKKDDVNLMIINDLVKINLIFKLKIFLYSSKEFYFLIKRYFNIK